MANGLQWPGCGLLQVVPATQALDAALRVHDPLLTGIEGMAIAADLHTHGGLGGAGVEHVATRARDN